MSDLPTPLPPRPVQSMTPSQLLQEFRELLTAPPDLLNHPSLRRRADEIEAEIDRRMAW